jgi:hypothetical protein
MAMTPKLWSLSGLAVELGTNIRTISGALANVPADGSVDGGQNRWYLVTALAALGATVPIRGHKLNGKASGQAGDDYVNSRTALATERAALLKLQRQTAEGRFVTIEEHKDTMNVIVQLLRSAALRMPTICAPNLIMLPTAAAAKEALTPYIHDMLTDLASTAVIKIEPGERSHYLVDGKEET